MVNFNSKLLNKDIMQYHDVFYILSSYTFETEKHTINRDRQSSLGGCCSLELSEDLTGNGSFKEEGKTKTEKAQCVSGSRIGKMCRINIQKYGSSVKKKKYSTPLTGSKGKQSNTEEL